MISSLYHHISIVKLTVHCAYLDFLGSGKLPRPLPEQNDWCRPILQRSHWHDLFDMEERVLAFRGIWGVMEYLNRPQPDLEKDEEKEQQQESRADEKMTGV